MSLLCYVFFIKRMTNCVEKYHSLKMPKVLKTWYKIIQHLLPIKSKKKTKQLNNSPLSSLAYHKIIDMKA